MWYLWWFYCIVTQFLYTSSNYLPFSVLFVEEKSIFTYVILTKMQFKDDLLSFLSGGLKLLRLHCIATLIWSICSWFGGDYIRCMTLKLYQSTTATPYTSWQELGLSLLIYKKENSKLITMCQYFAKEILLSLVEAHSLSN